MKKSLSQEILIIAVLVLTITLLWLYLSIYRVIKKNEGPTVGPAEMKVLDPNLDTKVLEELKKRKI